MLGLATKMDYERGYCIAGYNNDLMQSSSGLNLLLIPQITLVVKRSSVTPSGRSSSQIFVLPFSRSTELKLSQSEGYLSLEPSLHTNMH